MGGCYTPPCLNGMNEWLADRVMNQGVSVFGAVLQAEIATALTAGDTASAAQFTALGDAGAWHHAGIHQPRLCRLHI